VKLPNTNADHHCFIDRESELKPLSSTAAFTIAQNLMPFWPAVKRRVKAGGSFRHDAIRLASRP
jgi:hypothetical protein